MRRAAAVGATCAIGMTVVGCGVGGLTSPAGSTLPSMPTTMSVKQARTIMKGFDNRLDAAIVQGIGPTYDENAWRAVNFDGMLASNIYNTRIFRAAHDSRPAPTWQHTVKSVVGRTRSGGRDTVLLQGRARFHQAAGGKAKRQNVSFDALWVMERASSSGKWKLADQLALEGAGLPRQERSGGAASRSAQALAADPLKSVASVINGFQLDEFEGLAVSKPISNIKKQIQVAPDIDDNYSCYPRSAKPGTESVRRTSRDVVVLDSRTPALMALRLHCEVTHWARDKETSNGLSVPRAQAKVDGLPRVAMHAQEGYAVTVLMSVPSKGLPIVLDVSLQRALRKGAPHPLTPQGRPA